MRRKATAQDVADLAGVSRSSVSLVLNGRGAGNIAPHKQRAIIEAAERLNYTPNAVALSLRSQRTRTIGVLTWPTRRNAPAPILRAALQAATSAGYLLIFMDIGGAAEEQASALDTLTNRQVDGLLVIAPELTEYRPVDAMAGLPTVLVNCVDPQRTMRCIVADEAGAGARAAQVLIDAGHTRLGLLAGAAEQAHTGARVSGMHAVIAGSGIPTVAEIVTGGDVASAARAAHRLLRLPDPPTAVICTDERLAVGVTLAAAEIGLAIPDDLSLITLADGEQLASELTPPVTAIERPDAAMAKHAIDLLLEAIEDDAATPAPLPKRLTFVSRLVKRGSVAAPRVAPLQPSSSAAWSV